MRSKLFALFILFQLATPACKTTSDPSHHSSVSHAKVSKRHTESALHYWLQRASQFSNSPEDLRQATAQIAELWRLHPNAPIGSFQLSVISPKKDRIDPLFFDQILSADSCNTRSLMTRHIRNGIGAPLIGRKIYPPSHPLAKYQPKTGIERPITAVLTFSTKDPQNAILTFYDPDQSPTVHHQPLAADFSAPLSNSLGNIRQLRRQGFLGLIRSGDPDFAAGFVLTTPYDPHKTPLILVHGLLSSQAAWRNVANDLMSDPDIRKRFQIWFYHYPTGNPVLVSAQMFRQNLDRLRRDLNPSLRDPAMQQSVIIAHSMGGLLSKTLITTTGDQLWNRTFTVSDKELPDHLSQRQALLDTFQWKARPEVNRVIYIAVPHRGSKLAASCIGRFAQHLIRLPKTIISISTELVTLDADALTDEAAAMFETLNFNSIRNLTLDDPTLLALDQLPVAPWVHQHSIIGAMRMKKSVEQSSDGVVPYHSSHLDEADSELVVRSHHGAYKKPQTVKEIIRILKLP